MKRVLLDAASLKISKPGHDVDTATLSQLLLYLGLNFGQVLQIGLVFLPQVNFQTPSYHRAVTLGIGPYDAVPEVFVCGIWNGSITIPPHLVIDATGAMEPYFMLSYSITASQLYIAAHHQAHGGYNRLADHALYIIYRKPA